jgi:hypothetical protein
VIAANNMPNNLGYLICTLSVHGKEGINVGKFDPGKYTHITLPDYKAIIIQGDDYEIIE